MIKSSKIYVAGHRGMVGSALWRELESNGYTNLIGKNKNNLNLTNQQDVLDYIELEKPRIIINAAARVGGILANNNYPYQFLMENMQIQNNLIHAAHEKNIEKFIFIGSSCIYPKLSPQPLKEEYLLTDSLEPTNEWYAIAKISGIKLCESIRKQYQKDFVSLMPTNLYGPFDNYDLKTSHVLPAMIRKFHEAKNNEHSDVLLWGSGKPMREFLYVDDLARAVVFAIENKLPDFLYNVGVGEDVTIVELAKIVQKIIGHKGKIKWDISKPDGTPRKLLDVSKMHNLGWKAKYDLETGLKITYDWFLNHLDDYKKIKIIS
tara:strand:+ start:1161 stop:2117 length:957 start_codon:yes stop_codon:yes gene_type:complete